MRFGKIERGEKRSCHNISYGAHGGECQQKSGSKEQKLVFSKISYNISFLSPLGPPMGPRGAQGPRDQYKKNLKF